MLQNKRKCEYGTISFGISIALDYKKNCMENGQEITADIHKAARLDIDPKFMRFSNSHSGIFAKILDFQKGANNLICEVKRLLTAGQYLKFSITTSAYESVEEYTEITPFGPRQSTINPLCFNAWEYSGDGMGESDGADLSEDGGGLHLMPDTKYTNEMHDIWIPWDQDIFKVLEEADI